jgi:hypothetical protein
MSARQVRHPRFAHPSRGVRLAAHSTPSAPILETAALLAAPSDAVLCDVSAARFWGLPLPPWIGLEVDTRPVGIAVPRGHVRQRRTGVHGRRLTLPPEHLTRHAEVTVTLPSRTWLDCAETLPIEHVVAMGDAMVRRGLADDAELRRMVAWGKGRRGIRNTRRALGMLDPAAESPSESIVRCHLVLDGIPRPVCNLDIVVDGEWLARADLAWIEERVIVEYDGADHGHELRRRSDAARRNLLQDRGWLVIVFTARDLARPGAMADLVRSALRSRTSR